MTNQRGLDKLKTLANDNFPLPVAKKSFNFFCLFSLINFALQPVMSLIVTNQIFAQENSQEIIDEEIDSENQIEEALPTEETETTEEEISEEPTIEEVDEIPATEPQEIVNPTPIPTPTPTVITSESIEGNGQ